jgi:hypothetical protein
VLKISRNKTAASDIQPKVCPNINIRVEMEEKKEKKLKREVIFIYSNNSLSIMQSVQDEVSS